MTSVSSRAHIARSLLGAFNQAGLACPHHVTNDALPHRLCSHQQGANEYAFEMRFATTRFGAGVTREVGLDLKSMGAKNTLVVTDGQVCHTPAFQAVVASLTQHNCEHKVFESVKIEPTDVSFQLAMESARVGGFDSFVAVGGGSVIDTTKCAALFAANTQADLFDYTNKPAGKGLPPAKPMLPLIAVPTTAGTGSETTSVAVFDVEGSGLKTAIRTPLIKPHLAIVDPLNVLSMPRFVAIYSGLDVLCHALESYTAKPFNQRAASLHPKDRPVYQGSNPISDVWSSHALDIMKKYFKRSVEDPSDIEARTQMHLAACYAGVGFGNAGVHLCHGLSYSISGQGKKFKSDDYPDDKALVPHGLSVCLTAPAVFEFCGPACPERHVNAARMLGNEKAATGSYGPEDSGAVLSDTVKTILQSFGVPNGLSQVGFNNTDVDKLTEGAMTTLQTLSLSPRQTSEDAMREIYTNSLTSY